MINKKCKAVLWDVDNTLIMSGSSHDKAVLQALSEFRPKCFHDGANQPDILARAWDESWFACGGSLEQADAFEARVSELYLLDLESMVPRQGAVDAVKMLSAKGIPQATVSNSRRHIVDANLQHLGIAELIQIRICREDVSAPKPNPEPYLRAASALALPPSACLAIDDSPRGCLAAKNAGTNVIYWFHESSLTAACDLQTEDIRTVDWEKLV